MSNKMSQGIFAFALASAFAGSAFAGGLERAGYNIDLLFDPSKAAFEAGVVFVNPDRQVYNTKDTNAANGSGTNGIGGGTTTARDASSYSVPRFGVKVNIFDSVDCLADYSQPWGIHAAPGRNWKGANSNTETRVDSYAVGATCSYKTDLGKGDLRFIGGVFYEEVSGFKERLVAPPNALRNGIGRLDLEGDGYGWRAGVAYEIPEYAMRASLVYNSAVDLGDVTGSLDLRQVNGSYIPVVGTASMPDSVELKLQSGIAPDWLAFGSVKWTDWSQLQSIGFCPSNGGACPAGGITSLDLLYKDGWTVSGGIGHKFNDQWSAAATLTWDKGTTTGLTTQTDTWTIGAGVGYTPTKNVEFRLGGAVGILTSGSVHAVTSNGVTYGKEASYDFDNDVVTALSTSVRVKF